MKIAVITIGILAVLAVCYFLVGEVLFDIFGVRRREQTLQSPANVKGVGGSLARLCQTSKIHPEWFADEPKFAPAWAPTEVLNLHPSWVHIEPDSASVEFGGGFYHFGYHLNRDSNPSGGDSWTLSLYREEKADVVLDQFILGAESALNEQQFVDRALAEFDRRSIGSSSEAMLTNESNSVAQRCQFAIKHNRVEWLKRSIHESARHNPHNWRDTLLVYLIDSTQDRSAATTALQKWANDGGDFSHWLLAAYAFDEARDFEGAADAINHACRFAANDPGWLSQNARCRGLAMCQRLYTAGKYTECAALCENLLNYSGSRDYLSLEISGIQAQCMQAKSGTPPALHAMDKGILFDPFELIDLNVLRSERK